MISYSEFIFDRNRENDDQIVLVDRNGYRTTTWYSLKDMSRRVAAYAIRNRLSGVIPVCMERSAEAVAVLLGLNLAGVGVTPLAENTPTYRSSLIAEETGNAVWTRKDFDSAMACLPIEPDREIPAADPALVIFTSGSTGTPKGVMLGNEAVIHSCIRSASDWLFDYRPTDIALQTASFSFVAILEDLMVPLYAGATVHILPEMARKDARLLTNYINTHGITTAVIPSKLLPLLGDIPSMRIILTGSERLSRADPKGYRMVNGYGMSETACIAVTYPINSPMENPPIGKPHPDFHLYLLDENGDPAEEGEICFSGSITMGYYNRPDLNAEFLLPNPFPHEPGHEILLRSGDLARRLPDGNLLFLNRKDFMLKINGQRVEPGEAEAVFRQTFRVRDAAVLGFTEPDGRTYLCAYYESDEELDPDDIRRALARKLPSYLVPSYYVRLEKFPLNPNGKLDRKALTPPVTSAGQGDYVPPLGETEKLLCRAFEQVLKISQVGAADEFLRLGGDSIRAMEVVRLVPTLPLTAQDILLGSTPRGIAKHLDQQKENTAPETGPREDLVPLTNSQMDVYLQCMLRPDSVMYNIPLRFSLPRNASMTPEAVKQAADSVLALHPALYSCLKTDEDGIKMCRNPFPQEGLCTTEERDSVFSDREEESFLRPFVLTDGPLCRMHALLTPYEVLFYLDCHHIVGDGTSLSLLARQVCDALAGLPVLPEEADAFSAGQLLKKRATEERLAAAESHFESLLAGVELDSNLLFDHRSEEEVDRLPAGWVSLSLSLPGAEDYLRDHAMTKNSFFMGVFGYALAKMTGQTKALFAVAENGRKDTRLDRTVSMFVHTLPVLVQFDETKPASDLLREVQEQFFLSMQLDDVSFGELSREYGVTSDVMFVYQSDLLSDFEHPLGHVTMHILPVKDTFVNFALTVFKCGNSYQLDVQYRRDRYERNTIERFLTLYGSLCRAFLKNMVLKDIPLVEAQDRNTLQQWNETALSYNENETVVDAFRRMAKLYPEKAAVVCRETRYTYREADALTDRLAAFLLAQGIEKGQTISVLIPRNEYMVLTSIGILKAGAVYEPLDPSYPSERLGFMCRDADSKLLIADRELLSLLPEYDRPILCLDELPNLPAVQPDCPPPTPDDDFVLLYTSGTTGLPKGCQLTHRNIMAYVAAYTRLFSLDAHCIHGSNASFGFDASASELFPTVMVGGTVHIIPEDIRLDLPALKDYFEANGVTHAFMTTQLSRQFVTEYPEVRHLRHLLTGGEKLSDVTPPKTYTLTNGYGPSETTVMITSFPLDRDYEDIPIGKALPNTKLYVVDAFDRWLPIGAPGELVAAGPQVCNGYLNREDKTKEVFVPNTFEEKPEPGYEHCYRTGDIVRFREDGNLEFIGRRDMQVKVRGFRIELSEVEAVIREYPEVRDVTVVAVDAPSGGKCLHAYIVSDEKVDIRKLNLFIKERKPAYMIPAAVMQIESIPLTPNLKVDKRKLPPITGAEDPSAEAGSSRALTELEEQLSALLQEIVGHSNFTIETDFASAGITSISSIALAVQIYKRFGLHITSKDILDGGTILSVENAVVASLMATRSGEDGEEAPQEMPDRFPLTQTQIGIYTDCLRSGLDTYNIPLLLKLAPDLSIEKLKDALTKAVKAHPSLLCHIYPDATGEPAIYPVPDMDIIIEEETVTSLAIEPTHFTFTEAPLFRFRILHRGQDSYLFAELHHIIADGESVRILCRDIKKFYDGETVEAEPYTAFRLSLEEQKARSGEALSRARLYYDSLFQDVSSDYLPCPDRFGESAFGETDLSLTLQREAIQTFCSKVGISEAILFSGAFALTLARFTAHEDALFATVQNGRSDPRTENLVSMLAKTIPFYIETAPETQTEDFLRQVDDRMKKLTKYDLFSFADAAKEYGVTGDPMFVYQGDRMARMPLGEITRLENYATSSNAKSAFSVELLYKENAYRLHCEYNSGQYSKEWIEGFGEAYAACVSELLSRSTLGQVDLCSEKALEQFADFNDTDWDVPYRPAYRMIEESVLRHPEKAAVVACGETLSYRELDYMANDLAQRICALGIPENSTVELLIGRTKEIYIAQIGVLKSANAFLSLALDYPDERIGFITEDSNARAIITTHAIAAERKDLLDALGIPVLYADDIAITTEAESLNLEVAPDALAYLIYTSGSTGKPKGVTVTQRGLVNVSDPNPKNPETTGFVDDTSVSAAVSAFTFDASIFEGFMALANGSTVCIAGEKEIHDPSALCELCLSQHVTSLLGTPSFLMYLTEYKGFAEVAGNLRVVLAGGEDFPTTLLDRLLDLNPNLSILNGYGPSEATVTCSCKSLKRGDPITIGTPLANTQLFCLDAQNHILPMGALGELTVLGDGVGKGYLNRDDLTKKAFITVQDKPAFKTGDLAVITHDGDVVFHGRIDNQVKIRGLRVELGEIESVMNTIPGMKNSVVLVKGNEENRYLAAYYTADRPISSEEIIGYISQKLTRYMVPRVYLQLDAMPMTVNGKIARKSLPEIRPETLNRTGEAPATKTEKLLCDLFASILELPEVFANDNFFELGGNSLAASKVVMQLKSQRYEVEYQTIFDCQTPRSLAAFLGDSAEKPAGRTTLSLEDENDPTDPSLRDVLQYNTMEYADQVTREPLGDILLTGAVGFLGIHVLQELLQREEGHIYCLVRHGSFPSAEHRLNAISFYYFGECLCEVYPDRITPIDADITAENLSSVFRGISIDTIFNCAASVKHFSADNTIEFVNVHGAENMIALAKEKAARLIHISTTSVPGVHTDESARKRIRLHENQLFTVDDLGNRYVISKRQAELCVLGAIREGLRAKIIRVGNLMGRYSDGEFQINMTSNAFLNALKGFVTIGKAPVGHGTDPMEFSPIDLTAQAVVTLAGTNDRFTLFHANNRYSFDEMILIDVCNRLGLPIVPTEDRAYYAEYKTLLGDSTINKYLSALVTNDRKGIRAVEVDNRFTANVLYRLGFIWPFMDNGYLERAIGNLKSMGFFDRDPA